MKAFELARMRCASCVLAGNLRTRYGTAYKATYKSEDEAKEALRTYKANKDIFMSLDDRAGWNSFGNASNRIGIYAGYYSDRDRKYCQFINEAPDNSVWGLSYIGKSR